MGYIAHNSIPEAMAPRPSASLPFITTSAPLDGARVSQLQQGDVRAVDLFTLLSEGVGDLLADPVHVAIVDAGEHPERENVFALARIVHERQALLFHGDRND